jgi:hypothetical protein
MGTRGQGNKGPRKPGGRQRDGSTTLDDLELPGLAGNMGTWEHGNNGPGERVDG